MRPDEGAGRSLAGDRASAGAENSTAIFAPGLRLGNCAGCGIRIAALELVAWVVVVLAVVDAVLEALR